MTNIRSIAPAEKQTAAQGLRAIATALENGTLAEPPFALVVFGLRRDQPELNVIPVGGHSPNELESIGMLTMAAQALAFGEGDTVADLPVD